jgi:hypothetical protein
MFKKSGKLGILEAGNWVGWFKRVGRVEFELGIIVSLRRGLWETLLPSRVRGDCLSLQLI